MRMMGGGGWYRYVRNGLDGQPAKQQLSWSLVKRVLSYAQPYRKQIILLLVLILMTTGLNLLNPLIFRDLIDNALQPPGDLARLNLLALGLIAIPVVNGVLRVIQRQFQSSVAEGVIYDLRGSLYGHLQRMSLRFFTNTRTGEIVSRLNNDVVGAQNAISSTIVDIITNLVQVTATLLIMLTLEWRLTIIGVLVLPIFILIARRLGGRLRVIVREQMENDAQMNAMMGETLNISGTLLVKLFGRRDNEVERFNERAAGVREAGIKRAVVGSQFFVLISLVGVIGTALVYWVGGYLVIQDAFTIGTIVAFGTYLTQLYGPLQALTNAPVDFATSMVSFERVFEIIDLPVDIDEKDDAVHLARVRGELRFEGVTFVYNSENAGLLSDVKRFGADSVGGAISGEKLNGKGRKNKAADNGAAAVNEGKHQAREKALEGIDFHIQPGQLVALVGPSGAGKTTMTYLIPRLYDPTEGRICLDGYDLRDLTLDTLSGNIGMVTQETYLFHDTIRVNLLYARPDATEDELEAACRAANIHDFIMGLPDGYDTIVGERGYRLSGGEKQRMAIARVILKNPRLLVLDEATSHLDSQSEALIQDALAKVQQGRTSIVIAHRLSTILAADQIFVMDRGRIVERGTHDELQAQGGLYASLYETQFSQEREAV